MIRALGRVQAGGVGQLAPERPIDQAAHLVLDGQPPVEPRTDPGAVERPAGRPEEAQAVAVQVVVVPGRGVGRLSSRRVVDATLDLRARQPERVRDGGLPIRGEGGHRDPRAA